MNHFKRQGVILHFADQSGCTLDLSTGEGEFMFTILLAAASLEPRRTADRISKAMKHRQDNGQPMIRATRHICWNAVPECLKLSVCKPVLTKSLVTTAGLVFITSGILDRWEVYHSHGES
jgi:DNA invertase Pin-like site-specific DNA recombinase